MGLNVKEEPPPPPPPVVMPQVTVVVPKIEEPKPEPVPVPKPEMKPEVTSAPPAPPAPPKPKEGDFVEPPIPPIEEVTKNWSVLPVSVFPRKVKISKDLEVKGKVGGTKVAAGSEAFALSQDGAELVMASSPDSPFRGKLAIEDTNIKDAVIAAYESYRTTTIENARKLWAAEKEAKKNPVKVAAKKLTDDKPTQAKDGTYQILLDSMSAGEVTEIKKDNVTKWGEVKKTKLKGGEEVWQVSLTFTAKTPFGNFDQEALAHVKNQKVTKWIYAGSGEVIP
jgi:hypothetical protein